MLRSFEFSESFGAINLVTRLDVTLTKGTNINTSKAYDTLKLKVTAAVSV